MGRDAALLEKLDSDKLVIDPLMPRVERNLPLFAQTEQFALRNLQIINFNLKQTQVPLLTVKTEKSLSFS